MSTSTYKTVTGAAVSALDHVIGQSEKTGWEYAGRIVKFANGKYAYTSPTALQSSTESDPNGGMNQAVQGTSALDQYIHQAQDTSDAGKAPTYCVVGNSCRNYSLNGLMASDPSGHDSCPAVRPVVPEIPLLVKLPPVAARRKLRHTEMPPRPNNSKAMESPDRLITKRWE